MKLTKRLFPVLRLEALLERKANNFDLVRLFCAAAVIYGHTSIIVRDPSFPAGLPDPSNVLRYPGVYSASIAVKVFFFISGLLVTNSLLERKSVRHYLTARFLRIWPALFVTVVATAFVIGPIFSNLAPHAYFSDKRVYGYILGNLLLFGSDHLPGLFVQHPLPRLVNGALWTLTYEVGAYVFIFFAGLAGILERKFLCAVLLVVAFVDPLLPQPILSQWLPDNPQIRFLPQCFAFGAFLAVMKREIVVGPWTLAGLKGLFLQYARNTAGSELLHIALFSILLYLAGHPWFNQLRLPADPSYGTYVWGFVIQQTLVELFPHHGLLFHFFTALALAISMGFLSWYWIERPALRKAHQSPRLPTTGGAGWAWAA
jgi:peptidoglycan/LPS O-acetylase OafA/YrhL